MTEIWKAWIIAGYESDTSSHVGSEHYRSTINRPDVQILGLCGAGNVARALHGLNPKESPPEDRFKDSLGETHEAQNSVQVFGLGLWNPYDTKILAKALNVRSAVIRSYPNGL